MRQSIHLIDLGLNASNAHLVEQMRFMRRSRAEGIADCVACTVRGFHDDPRELQDIPEVQAFCRRLVGLGFLSDRDFTTQLVADCPEPARHAWGAAEVWLCGEGRLRDGMPITRELVAELESAVIAANGRADEVLGAG